MGSPPVRLLALALAVVVCGVAAATARADEQGARATVSAYLDAVMREDAKGACSLYSPRALERMGGAQRCERSHAAGSSEADYEAISMIRQALRAAEKSAVERRGQFVTKTFRAAALAREMEKIDEKLTIRLGNGPRAAVGQLATTVVLDRRTTGRRVVLYVESDDGSILRLSSTMLGDPEIQEVAQGVAEGERPPSVTFSFEVGNATILGDGTAWVDATMVYEAFGITERLRMLVVLTPAGSGYAVDDVYYSTLFDLGEGG